MAVKIRYIGLQPRKRASQVVERCHIVWEGHGDVQEVPEDVASVLLQSQYKKIWERVVDEPAPPPPPPPVTPEASSASVQGVTGVTGANTGGAAPAEDPPIDTDEVRKRLEEIVLVIPKLEEREFHNGKPTLKALSSRLGRNVTAAERDAAWDAVVAHSGTPAADQRPADAAGDAPE